MSNDSFESSTLGPKAAEAQKKRLEEEQRRKGEETARRLKSIQERENWKRFQEEVEKDRDKGLADDSGAREDNPPPPPLQRGLPKPLAKVATVGAGAPGREQSEIVAQRLRRF